MITWYSFIPIVVKSAMIIGTSIGAGWLALSSYANHVTQNYQIIVPEISGKWGNVSQAGWDEMDSIYNFAQDNGLDLHYHTLVWWAEMPPDPCGFIREAMARYPDIMDWDVLNEGWTEYGPTSQVDVTEIYECAREARPDARLWYNGIFAGELERREVIKLIDAGLIDGVGIQFHVSLSTDISPMVETIRKIEHRVWWRVSELDVMLVLPPSAEDMQRQAELYERISAVCQSSPTCRNITIWGASDKESWIQWQYPGYGYATPFDYYYQAKSFWGAIR
jgi:endo-1,4-beta-xylanase